MPLSAEKVNLALEQAGGSLVLAAQLLDVPRHKVVQAIENNETLKARWGNGKGGSPSKKTPVEAPGPEVEYHREPLPEVPGDVLDTELAVAKAVAKEEELLKDAKKDLAALGFDREMVDLAAACHKFASKHYRRLTEMQSGGINRQFFKVIKELDKIDARLAETGEDGPDMQEQMMLRLDRTNLLKWLSSARDSTSKAFLTDAKVHVMMKGKQASKTERPRGFLDIKGANATA